MTVTNPTYAGHLTKDDLEFLIYDVIPLYAEKMKDNAVEFRKIELDVALPDYVKKSALEGLIADFDRQRVKAQQIGQKLMDLEDIT